MIWGWGVIKVGGKFLPVSPNYLYATATKEILIVTLITCFTNVIEISNKARGNFLCMNLKDNEIKKK